MSGSDGSQHCNFFVVRKKRYCRMTVKEGTNFCAEHQQHDLSELLEGSRRRILCPLDKKHSCYADKLEKHLKICNARPVGNIPYISPGANKGSTAQEDNGTKRSLVNIPVPLLLQLIKRINEIYEGEINNKISDLIKTFPLLEEELNNPIYGPKSKKHLHQTSSMIGIMNENGFLLPDVCYIEFGAGKGQLSYWIYKATELRHNVSVLLVERASQRHKYDNKLDKKGENVHRIRADIADLLLYKVDAVQNKKYVFGVSKHLCGEATDLAIRCLMNHEKCGKNVLGLMMAFCCHHRCKWESYVGKGYFDRIGLNREDFDIMCGLVSWATCGSGKSRDVNEKLKNGDVPANLYDTERYTEIGLDRNEREEVGRRCKHIIDWGRLKYLEGEGMKCAMNVYVNQNVSLENVCLVAFYENKLLS